jgi:hypothetical protein
MFKASSPEEVEKVKRLFQVKTDGGAIVQKVVPFNYYEILKPKTPREMRDALRGVKIELDEGGGNSSRRGKDSEGGSKQEDDIPF